MARSAGIVKRPTKPVLAQNRNVLFLRGTEMQEGELVMSAAERESGW